MIESAELRFNFRQIFNSFLLLNVAIQANDQFKSASLNPIALTNSIVYGLNLYEINCFSMISVILIWTVKAYKKAGMENKGPLKYDRESLVFYDHENSPYIAFCNNRLLDGCGLGFI